MRVLVTGGAGYVGAVSADALIDAGHDVLVLDDLTTGHRAAIPAGAHLVVGSYADGAFTEDLLRRAAVDAILHCAARSLVGESIREPARYYRENIAGGIALLEAARAAGVGRMVFSSSAAVYGDPDVTPIPEDAHLRPINPYGETKRTLEAGMRWYGEAYGLRGISLRYFNVAGATDRIGEVHDPETHLIPRLLAAVGGGEPLTLFGVDYPTRDGTPIRDYIDVADLADAHLRALEATGEPGDDAASPFQAFNLGSGDGFSVREVLAAAEAVIGRSVPHTVGPRRIGDPPSLVATNARARDVLGWTPRRSTLEGMIGSAWAWRQAHPRGYEA